MKQHENVKSFEAEGWSFILFLNSLKFEYNFFENLNNYALKTGADPGLSLGGGGGHKRKCAHTHITSAKPEVPFGRGPGTA